MDKQDNSDPKPKLDLLIAKWDFRCPLCGVMVKRNDFYIDNEGVGLCITCGLPERRLVPLKK